MITLIHYNNGRLEGAVLLSMSYGRLRFAIPGSDDVVELRRVSNRWLSDSGEVVEIRFSATTDPHQGCRIH